MGRVRGSEFDIPSDKRRSARGSVADGMARGEE